MFSSEEEKQHDRWLRERIKRKAEEEKRETQEKYNDYRNHLKISKVYPIRLSPCYYKDIKGVIEEGLTYAPPGGMIQLRLHNYQEPFKHPALRIEILGVSPNNTPVVLSRYEVEQAPLEFANELLDTDQTFSYIPEQSEELIDPWTVTYLEEISYTEPLHRSNTYGRRTHILREEGLYFMLPCF